MDSSYVHQHNVVSLEADSFGFGRMTGSGVVALQSYLHNMKEFMFEMSKPLTDNGLVGFVRNRDTKALVSDTNYVTLSSCEIHVPAGMSSTYLELVEALHESQKAVHNVIDRAIQPAINYFGLLLSTPDTMSRAAINPYEKKIVLNRSGIRAAKHAVGECFRGESHVVKMEFAEVFSRVKEWEEVTVQLEELTNQLAEVSPAQVSGKVTDLVDLLDRLILRMEQSPEVYQANGITGKAMADIVMGIGEEVEYYAAHVHTVQMSANVMTQNNARISEFLSKAK